LSENQPLAAGDGDQNLVDARFVAKVAVFPITFANLTQHSRSRHSGNS
jgi:hypothetical protein